MLWCDSIILIQSAWCYHGYWWPIAPALHQDICNRHDHIGPSVHTRSVRQVRRLANHIHNTHLNEMNQIFFVVIHQHIKSVVKIKSHESFLASLTFFVGETKDTQKANNVTFYGVFLCVPKQSVGHIEYHSMTLVWRHVNVKVSHFTGHSTVCTKTLAGLRHKSNQLSASLAFCAGIHRWILRTKGQWHGKYPCYDIMNWMCYHSYRVVLFSLSL